MLQRLSNKFVRNYWRKNLPMLAAVTEEDFETIDD